MNVKEEKNLTLRIIEYGLKNEPFKFDAMKEALKLDNETVNYVITHLITYSSITSPNHIISTVSRYNNQFTLLHIFDQYVDVKFRVLPSAAFSYIDHEEIIEARKAARTARNLSWMAIAVSVILATIQIVFGK